MSAPIKRLVALYGYHRFRWDGQPKEEGKTKHHKKCVTCGCAAYNKIHDTKKAKDRVNDPRLTIKVPCPACCGEGLVPVDKQALVDFLSKREGDRGA